MDMHNFRAALNVTAITLALGLAGCGGGGDNTPVAPPLAPSLAVGSNIPEDVAVDGSTAYVSSLSDGTVLRMDLASGKTSTFATVPEAPYLSGWGLRVETKNRWLLSVQNVPYDFNPAHAQAGHLVAYDLANGSVSKSWNFPAQMVGNSVDVDDKGRIYVGDIGPNTRILRIDPASGAVSVWATDSRWKLNGFGIGGMVFDGKGGLYASHDNALWYIGINADGTAATPAKVSVTGDPVIFADGMTWSDDGIYYAENDLFAPGAHGTLFRLTFSNPMQATRTAVKADLFDPSGVTTATVDGRRYLIVLESRLGYAVGTETGTATGPYNAVIVQR